MEQINEIVNVLLENEVFSMECNHRIEQIFADGKIDMKDLPHFIILVTEIYNTQTTIKINKRMIKNVLKGLMLRLIEDKHLLDHLSPEDRDLLMNSFEAIFSVLSLTVNPTINKCNWFKSCYGNTHVSKLDDTVQDIMLSRNPVEFNEEDDEEEKISEGNQDRI